MHIAQTWVPHKSRGFIYNLLEIGNFSKPFFQKGSNDSYNFCANTVKTLNKLIFVKKKFKHLRNFCKKKCYQWNKFWKLEIFDIFSLCNLVNINSQGRKHFHFSIQVLRAATTTLQQYWDNVMHVISMLMQHWVNNANSSASGVCHSRPKVITHLSKKFSYHPHFPLTSRQ